MAIKGTRLVVQLLTSTQLESVPKSLLSGLMSLVNGGMSTAILSKEACEATDELVERVPTLNLLV